MWYFFVVVSFFVFVLLNEKSNQTTHTQVQNQIKTCSLFSLTTYQSHRAWVSSPYLQQIKSLRPRADVACWNWAILFVISSACLQLMFEMTTLLTLWERGSSLQYMFYLHMEKGGSECVCVCVCVVTCVSKTKSNNNRTVLTCTVDWVPKVNCF